MSARVDLAEKLSNNFSNISSGISVVCDPASLKKLTSSDGVVFIERVDYSPYNDIQKEVDVCKKYDVPVIRSVVIE